MSHYWGFEDRRINFGIVDAAADDLGCMLLLAFALVYGNDFFLVPLELPVDSLCRIDTLVMHVTFGEVHTVDPAASLDKGKDVWRIFTLSVESGEADNRLLFLPPALGVGFEGQVLEEVAFACDEMTNLVWAIERQMTSPLHKPIQRHEQWARRRLPSSPSSSGEPAPPLDGESAAHYRPISEAPDYW